MMFLQTTFVITRGDEIDLGPHSSVSSLWLLVFLFIVLVFVVPKIKAIKGRFIKMTITQKVLLFIGIILIGTAFYYLDVMSIVKSLIG